jgi:multicomponent K+:H+ antiporter subunit D
MSLLATHLPLLAVLLPAATAVLLLALGDQGAQRLARARGVALVSTALGLLVAAALVARAAGGELMVYRVGDWPAPFGIALVVDRLGAMMVLLAAVVALAALLYASAGWDARGRYFHAMFQFQLMGLNGAFVTGDLFNLFVFFEVLLIASYVLMLHGLGGARLRAGTHYVVLNLVASALFLVGVSLLYAKTGTLNFADLSLRVPQVTGPDAALVQAAALVLLVVFAFKAALMPLALWLPATYSAASAPVAALFAIMTKVGVYAIVRVHGVIFGPGQGEAAAVAEPVLLAAALVTGVIGAVGALAAPTLGRVVGWLTVASVGTAVAAVGLFSGAGWAAALYYLAHSTLAGAVMFLLVELLARQRGAAGDRLETAAPLARPALLGVMLLVAAAAVAGLPPLPGFVGKLMVLQAAQPHPSAAWVWAIVLLIGFLSLVALARAGSIVFWQVRDEPAPPPVAGPRRLVLATGLLMAASIALVVFAAPVQRYTEAAAAQLADRVGVATAVLGEAAVRNGTTRPYRFDVPGVRAPASAAVPATAAAEPAAASPAASPADPVPPAVLR